MNAVTDGADSTFPLLTLEWLQADPAEATKHFPPGVAARTWAEGVLFWDIEGERRSAYMIDLLLGAILTEAARFRGAVATGSNGKENDPSAQHYLRFRPSKTGPDTGSFVVARVVMDAGANQKVPTAANPMDLRRESLTLVIGSSAKRSARNLLMEHSRQCAVESGRDEAYQAAYLANLERLIDRYDMQDGFIELSDEEIDAVE